MVTRGRLRRSRAAGWLARYDRGVQTLVISILGEDRAGLVSSLAEVVSANGGNWERSQLAELAGKFAGIVVVTVPEGTVEAFRKALEPVAAGLIDLQVDDGGTADTEDEGGHFRLSLLGTDRPGIVAAVSGVLARQGINLDELATETRDAPMAGGRLFEAHVSARVPTGADLGALRAELERLADEIQVDLSLEDLA